MCRLLKGLYSYFIRINDIDCCLGEAHGCFFPERFPLLDLVCQSLQRSIPAGAGWTCQPDWPQIWKFLVFFAKTLLENNCTNINILYGLILRTN